MASYENGAVRHTPHSNGRSNGHSNMVVSNPMVGPNGQEPMRVAFFTASYFVLDGVTLTIRKLLAALKQVRAWACRSWTGVGGGARVGPRVWGVVVCSCCSQTYVVVSSSDSEYLLL